MKGTFKNVIPTKVGIQDMLKKLDSGFRRNDENRYIRQITLPEIGEDGQKKLRAARVLAIGAGGLGSPVLLYLAGAGVGTIGVVDSDVVEEVNLHRQVIHSIKTIGQPKAVSAAEKIKDLNPEIEIHPMHERLTDKNAEKLFFNYDLILDCSDNFPTRYVINGACLATGRPWVHGSILKYTGQVSIFCAKDGPCYSCVYPEPPPPEVAPSGSVAGILGMMPGIIGTMQALEAVKFIVGFGEPAVGKLLIFDGLTGKMRALQVGRDAKCHCDAVRPKQSPVV